MINLENNSFRRGRREMGDRFYLYLLRNPLKIPRELEALGVIVLYTDKYSPNKRITL